MSNNIKSNFDFEATYNPKNIEQNWYKLWEEKGYFKPDSARTSKYSIVIPPPNVTGSLHMGHAFQYTIMDILIRFNRMDGKKTLWQMGTDAAGIATQMVVERQLNQQNIKKSDLTREEFVNKVWEWKEKSGGRISQQIRRLGASVDWSRDRFTMDSKMQKTVNKAFVELYDNGLIYRGNRLVNWDPVLFTALSDLEVENIEKQGHIWHIKYPLVNPTPDTDYIIVATTRPETLLGDTAVAVNPKDPRYKDFIDQKIKLPLTDRTIPIIADDYVDLEFGSGAVKITPAHDFNDFEVGKRHNLPIINIFTKDAKLNANVPSKYQHLTREQARKVILQDLEDLDLILKVENHTLKIPLGDRSGAIIEPYLVPQWYIKIDSLAKPARTVVNAENNTENKINFVPPNYVNMYNSWMDNIQDWCISRQLWWGNRIPAWYDSNGNIYVADTIESAIQKYNLDKNIQLTQEQDTLDTWFASALWPAGSLGWPEDTQDVRDFYPTNVLVTGFDIIFFWVARMVMMSLYFNKQIPFKNVYFTGLIRDSQGQKMSKSKGNIIDPLDLIDGIDLEDLIAQRTINLMQPKLAEKIANQTRKEFPKGISAHGTDALRFTLCALASQSRNINFDLKRMEGYRNFCNKLWNAARYVLLNSQDKNIGSFEILQHIDTANISLADKWILSSFQDVIVITREHIENYRFDLLAQSLYEFFWDQYCDWYLEFSKTVLAHDAVDQYESDLQTNSRFVLLYILENVLRLLHPIIPFITEEIWQKIKPLLSIPGDSIMIETYPVLQENLNLPTAHKEINFIKDIILGIRNIRGENNISPSKAINKIYIKNTSESQNNILNNNKKYIYALGKVESYELISKTHQDSSMPHCATIIINGEVEILIPTAGLIDIDAELNRIDREIIKLELDHHKITSKLKNENFVSKAPPAVVSAEQERLAEIDNVIVTLRRKCELLRQKN